MPKYVAFAGMAESDAENHLIAVWDRWRFACLFCHVLKKWFALSGPMFSAGLATLTAAAIYLYPLH